MSELGFNDWLAILVFTTLAAYGLYTLVIRFIESIAGTVMAITELVQAKKDLKQMESTTFLNRELTYRGLAAFDPEISLKSEEEQVRMLAVAHKWSKAFNDVLAESIGLDEDEEDFRIF